MPGKTRSKELIELLQQERLSAHEQLLVEKPTVRTMMGQLEEQVAKRLEALRAEVEAFDEIARLASELRKAGVEQSMLTQTIKRFDRSSREIKSITRQALDEMVAKYEGRSSSRTPRPSRRRRRGAKPSGGVNLEALR
jgi:prophage DNA circulation protein